MAKLKIEEEKEGKEDVWSYEKLVSGLKSG
jgi:hypothetical protein